MRLMNIKLRGAIIAIVSVNRGAGKNEKLSLYYFIFTSMSIMN